MRHFLLEVKSRELVDDRLTVDESEKHLFSTTVRRSSLFCRGRSLRVYRVPVSTMIVGSIPESAVESANSVRPVRVANIRKDHGCFAPHRMSTCSRLAAQTPKLDNRKSLSQKVRLAKRSSDRVLTRTKQNRCRDGPGPRRGAAALPGRRKPRVRQSGASGCTAGGCPRARLGISGVQQDG